jgi:molybdopterin molybdotransferase
MIPYREALDLLLENAPRLAAESCLLENATGRVLRQDIRADRAFPPFDRVMMDGYALRLAELIAERKFQITGIAPAGSPQAFLTDDASSCLEIMTGAPLPEGADCIVPVERAERDGDRIIVDSNFAPTPGLFIHRMGSDAAENELLLRSGILLSSCEIGVAASCGAAVLQVSKQPRITILPTGDELVAVDSSPAPHQIRQSNGHAIRSALHGAGYPSWLGDTLRDDAGAEGLHAYLESSDWLILTGAISKGARDFVPSALEKLGCRKLFHGVAQRPGKPAGCWVGPGGQMIVALPGNPVSAITGLHAFVLPALAAASGLILPERRMVVSAEPLIGLPDMTWHLPVLLGTDGRAQAAPTGNSGDFIGLLRSDGFVTLSPRGSLQTAYPFTPWR